MATKKEFSVEEKIAYFKDELILAEARVIAATRRHDRLKAVLKKLELEWAQKETGAKKER